MLSIQSYAQIVFESLINRPGQDLFAYNILETKDNGFIISGIIDDINTGVGSPFTAKIDNQGKEQWFRTYTMPRDEFWTSLIHAHDSGYLLTATTFSYPIADEDSASDILVLRIDSEGNEVWRKILAANNHNTSVRCVSGGYYIMGDALRRGTDKRSPDDFWDGVVYKIDNNGTIVWKTLVGTDNTEFMDYNGLYETKSGVLLCGGNTDSMLSGKDNNGFLVGIDNQGRVLWKHVQSNFDLRSNFIKNFKEINDTVYYNFNGFQALNPLTGELYGEPKPCFRVKAISNQQTNGHMAAIEQLNRSCKLKIVDQNFSELYNYDLDRRYRIFGEDAIAASDGGYAYLMRWQQDTGAPFYEKYTALIIKTDCNGNMDSWEECTLGDGELSALSDDYQLYPNPAEDFITITGVSAGKYSILSVDGQLKQNGVLTTKATTIDIANLPKGMYWLLINEVEANSKLIRKVVKL